MPALSPEVRKILNGGLLFALMVSVLLFILPYFMNLPIISAIEEDLNPNFDILSGIVLFGPMGAGAILTWYYFRRKQESSDSRTEHEVFRCAIPLFSSGVLVFLAGVLFVPAMQTKDAKLIFQLTALLVFAVLAGIQYWALSKYYGLEIRLWG
jgi:hypothetical protein